jgi:hypothetical protein
MTSVSVSTIPLATESNPAQRLRRMAAAVRVHFTWWGVHRTLTSQQKEEVGDAYGADARLLSAGKKIIDVRHEAFRKLTSVRSRIVSYWRGLTLPYVEPGVRLIRQADIDSFVHSMEGFKEELIEAEADLNTVYDDMKADAERRLGRLYNPYDYPVEVRGHFAVDWDFPSVEPPSYLMRLNPDLYQQEQERVTQRFEEAVRLAEQAFVAEFSKLVAHLTERLGSDAGGERKIFRDSVVTNLGEFFERFRQLNVRSNPELDHLVEQARDLVRGVTPQDLRESDSLREQVARQLAGVQTSLDDLMVDRPRRRILRANPSRNGESHAAAH